tara:strand:- start:2921 stop:3103 length:183 start_codon:yes stop_codon:yes gene_type:complete
MQTTDRNTETVYFFTMASRLNAARRSGDQARIAEAASDIEAIAMHSENQKIVQRAQAMLA